MKDNMKPKAYLHIGAEPQHTPTPWNVSNVQSWGIDAGQERAVARCYSKVGPEDAAFIVRAVNTHETLLKACKKALEIIGDRTSPLMDIPTEKVLRQAIAKAEGK